MISRRSFIKGAATMAAAILTPVDRVFRRPTGAASRPLGNFELYHGFVLLDEDEPIPDFVVFPHIPAEGDPFRGKMVSSVDAVPEPFKKDLRLRDKPKKHKLRDIYLEEHVSGTPNEALAAYIRLSKPNRGDGPTLSVRYLYPSPYPMRSSPPVEPGGPAVEVIKVDYLPSSGLMVPSARGYIYFWISGGLLYTLYVEDDPGLDEAKDTALDLATG